MNYWVIFLTGLTSGGVTCAAMQGGLLASVIANQEHEGVKESYFGPATAFLSAKLLIHFLFGALLGLAGSFLTLSTNTRLVFQGLTSLFMLATALNLLEVHPIFRYVAIQPPKFANKFIKSTTGSKSLFAPALLGLITILIPCGVTQAMEVLAINSGSPVRGALTMGFFVLGTAPMFLLIGVATAKFSEFWRTSFLRVAAAALLVMAAVGINGVFTALDSPLSIDKLGPAIVKLLPPYDSPASAPQSTVAVVDGVQKVAITIENSGYSPRYFRVKAGIPVELTLATDGGVYSCAASFTFRAFGIADFVSPNTTKVHTFTPDKPGIYTYSCSMGMYTGQMEVL